MDLKVISELVNLMGNSKLTSLEIEEKDFRVKLEKNDGNSNISSSFNKGINIENTFDNSNCEKTEVAIEEIDKTNEKVSSGGKLIENRKVIKAPIVGTFYGSPSPEAKAFVSVGEKVRKGQVLCIIEAMKLMNEIESEFDGELVEILVDNGQMVEYGQPLFVIE